ncbi:MAG: hypothetical protein PHE53_01640 [Thermoguttaceae bacterium]|nr:hypothetical protein [Thermoguttaceae bacterium]
MSDAFDSEHFPSDAANSPLRQASRDCLGWLNFSSGTEEDVRFLRAVSRVFTLLEAEQNPITTHTEPIHLLDKPVQLPPLGVTAPPQSNSKKKNTTSSTEVPCRFDGSIDFSRFPKNPPIWREFFRVLREELVVASQESSVFSDGTQASRVLDITEHHLLPGYRKFHEDLLFHQSDESLFQAFFVGRAMGYVLRLLAESESDSIPWVIEKAIGKLNDFIGYRPIPVLHNQQKMQPWPHEYVGAVPLWIDGAGVSAGPYAEVIEQMVRILQQMSPELLDQAWFNPNHLSEIAFDPRAYDYQHPASHRPNNQFGMWDMTQLDLSGYYRRFVLQQVTLEMMLDRVDTEDGIPREEKIFETGAVLAGTMLMGGAISGHRPDTHDSSMTLATLLPKIATFRDFFYTTLLSRLGGSMGERLQAEAQKMRQPFAGVRFHLNRAITHFRAEQYQRVRLAEIFANMGAEEEAFKQTLKVPVASARTRAILGCRLAEMEHAIHAKKLEQAETLSIEITERLHRAIECGAMVDPWCILGFDGHFSLSPSIEDTIIDERVDMLIQLLRKIFRMDARLLQAAAVVGDNALENRVSLRMEQLADWWDQYASTEVSTVESFKGREAWESAVHVAKALAMWQQGGTAAGDLHFWKQHAIDFHTAKSHALVVDALLERNDMVAAMGLLIHWLGQSDTIPLADGDYVFYRQAILWMEQLWTKRDRNDPQSAEECWNLARKMIAFLEANAGEQGEMPRFELQAGTPGGKRRRRRRPGADSERAGPPTSSELDSPSFDSSSSSDFSDQAYGEEVRNDEDDAESEDENSLFDAAYEDVVYRDTTDDGVDSEMMESGFGLVGDLELNNEVDRVSGRLSFLMTLSILRRIATSESFSAKVESAERTAVLDDWVHQSRQCFADSESLMLSIANYQIPEASNTFDSLMEYDQRQVARESLVERVIAVRVEFSDAARLCNAASGGGKKTEPIVLSDMAKWLARVKVESHIQGVSIRIPTTVKSPISVSSHQKLLEVAMVELEKIFDGLLHAALQGDRLQVANLWKDIRPILEMQPLLYTPLSRGGRVDQIDRSRNVQQMVQSLLMILPKLGLVGETIELLETVQVMESFRPDGGMAISEFGRHFDVACRELVFCCSATTMLEKPNAKDATEIKQADEESDLQLLELMENMMICLERLWQGHIEHVRLSVLETVQQPAQWRALVRFVERYGKDLFTQRFFMTFGNLRAILLQGVEHYLRELQNSESSEDHFMLLDALDVEIPTHRAAEYLTTVIEAILENYEEYRDYNATTTQSDHGEVLYVFLDFLRLKANYDRHAWNLQPLGILYRSLLDAGRIDAAAEWLAHYRKFCRPQAKRFRKKLDALVQQYGVRLQSIDDRISEGLIQPLEVSRLCAWVRPAMEELRASDNPLNAKPSRKRSKQVNPSIPIRKAVKNAQSALTRLLKETDRLTSTRIGTGMDDPSWITALDAEVSRVLVQMEHGVPTDMSLPNEETSSPISNPEEHGMLILPIPEVHPPLDELYHLLEKAAERITGVDFSLFDKEDDDGDEE